jgi:hypothetical protein
LFDDWGYDVDRKVKTPSRELYFYPEWDNLPEIRTKMRALKDEIWRDEDKTREAIYRSAKFVKRLMKKKKTPIKM